MPPCPMLGIYSIWFFMSYAMARNERFIDLMSAALKRYGNMAPSRIPKKMAGSFNEMFYMEAKSENIRNC